MVRGQTNLPVFRALTHEKRLASGHGRLSPRPRWPCAGGSPLGSERGCSPTHETPARSRAWMVNPIGPPGARLVTCCLRPVRAVFCSRTHPALNKKPRHDRSPRRAVVGHPSSRHQPRLLDRLGRSRSESAHFTGMPKSPSRSRQYECTWLALFCVLLYSMRKVGPCTR